MWGPLPRAASDLPWAIICRPFRGLGPLGTCCGCTGRSQNVSNRPTSQRGAGGIGLGRMCWSFEFSGTENDRCLHGDEREAPANCLVIMLEVPTESGKVITHRLERSNGISRGVRVICVSRSYCESQGH